MKPLLKVLRAIGGLLILAAAAVGLFAFAGSFAEYPVVERSPSPRWVRGAYHVHSSRSHDGRGTEERVARAAKAAGLDFVILTEHNLERARPPRWVEGVLLVDGTELSTGSGHLVVLGASPDQLAAGSAAERHASALAHGAFTAVAHPVQRKNPWTDDAVARAATGFELYSYDSLFRETLAHPVRRLIPAVGAYLADNLHGLMQLARDVPEARARLLELARERAEPPVALCAVDAHGLVPYEAQLRALAMVVPLTREQLGPEPVRAAETVLEAFRSAKAFCSFHAIADPSGFELSGPASRSLAPGERLRVVIPAPAPPGAQVRVFGAGTVEPDGVTVRAGEGGALQVEVWADAPAAGFGTTSRPWLVASPFAVVSPGSK